MFGGQAGDGVREAGVNFGRLLTKLGYSVVVTADYQSLIRGGRNSTTITFSDSEVYSDYSVVDVLVGFNAEAITVHQSEVKSSGIIFFDQTDKSITASKNIIALPIAQTAKAVGAVPIMRSAFILGALCQYFNLPLASLEQIFTEVFKDRAKLNIVLAKEGFNFLKHLSLKTINLPTPKFKNNSLLSGNQASAEGLMKAGLSIYVAYPMTPASAIQEYLAEIAKTKKIKVIQPESEVAVINMALGSAYTGAKTAVGSSGGGFDLMQEGFSLAGMAEIPLVVLEVQRAGPSTGVPTYTGQIDLAFVRSAGHGEFVRLILAPGDAEEAYLLSALAMNLAWQYQIPVIVLTDKQIGESFFSVNLPTTEVKPGVVKGWSGKGEYLRYALTKDGVSPLAFPGTPNAVVKVNSYEHDELGLSTEEAGLVQAMQDKRFAKLSALAQEKFPRLKISGDKQAETAVIFWGSTKGAIMEANKYLTKPLRLIQVLCLEPFPKTEFLQAIKGAKKIVVVEGNHTGQLANLIQEQTGTMITNRILRYDGRAFDTQALARELTKNF